MILGRDNAIHIIYLVFSFFFLFFSGHFFGPERVRYLYLGMELRRGNVSQLCKKEEKKRKKKKMGEI